MSFLRPAVFALTAMLLSGPAFAADMWTVRKEESRLGFTAIQQQSEFEGVFKSFEAEIQFSPEDLAGSKVVVTVDTGSFDSASRDRDGQVGDKAWFWTASFPTARFETKSFRAVEGGFEAVGDLTIRDKTREVVLAFTVDIDGDVARMTGQTSLDRREFDVGTGQWADDGFVGFPVTVNVSIVADKTR